MGMRQSTGIRWGVIALTALGPVVYVPSCGPTSDPKAAPPATSAAKPAAAVPVASGVPAPAGSEPKVEPRGPAGWYATYVGPGASDSDWIKTASPFAAFSLAEGQTIHPAIAAGGVTASYAGEVTIEEAGRYRFTAQMQGGATKLSVFQGSKSLGQGALSPDQTAMETGWLDLPAGIVSVSVSFTRTSAGPARLRTMWEKAGAGKQGFREEPVPPGVVTVARHGILEAQAGRAAFHGRILIGELNCTACHDAPGAAAAVSPRTAPLMGEIGRRASPEWLLKWIKDPQSMRPGTAMPTIFGNSEQDTRDAVAVVHYLASLGSAPEWQAAANETRVLDEGARLYHSVGCVACHGVLDDPGKVFKEPVPPGSGERASPPAPFGKLSGKWRPAGLAEFLMDPVRTHPSGRMPSMALTKPEADLIATYLVNSWDPGGFKPAPFKPDPDTVEVGKAVFEARGCASCHQTGHQLPDVASTLAARPLADLAAGAGCLDPADTKSPRYTLSEQDRADIAAGLAELKKCKPAPAPIDAAHRLVEALNCRACHEINESGGIAEDIRLCFRTVDDAELGNEGRFPPRLTGVGMKLTTHWLKQVLTDAARTRPYMLTRMPQFGMTIGNLPAALAQMEGIVPGSDAPAPTVNDALIVAGRTLVGEKGMNCISCHVFSGKLAGTLGPDITGFAGQLRYEWWKPYLMNPQRFKPLTRMTAFYESGKGSITEVFGGDPDRQADALWAYFTSSTGGPPPEGLPTQGGLPVIVGAKPVIFRTFLKDGGSRGIAVGYPIGIHFGFDGTSVRLISAWKGEFIDATSAWKGRGGMTATGQGKTIWIAPTGPSLVIGPRPETWPNQSGSESGYRFEGYRMNDKGVPIFLYRVGTTEVEEMFEPADQGQIRRTFTVKGVPAGASIWFNAGPGVVSSTAIANVAEDRAAAIGEAKVEGYTPKDSAQPISFVVLIKPEVK